MDERDVSDTSLVGLWAWARTKCVTDTVDVLLHLAFDPFGLKLTSFHLLATALPTFLPRTLISHQSVSSTLSIGPYQPIPVP